MAQHGYLRDYDESDNRGDDRDRWRDDDRERGWRGSERSDRDRDFMFRGRDRSDRNRGDDDRGFFDRMGDEARSWFRDDDREARGSQRDRGSHYGREHGYGGFQGDFSRSGREQGGFGGRGDWERSPRNFSSHPDDHYRSWRDKQMQALDRDYADYCREREQQFHSDFDAWRSQRRGNEQPLRTGMTQTAEEVMELDNPAAEATPSAIPTPMGAATLGTNTDESTSGRGRR